MNNMKGDLSAPVLAIIVTIGIISAGLVLLAWFWWFAPQAGRTGVIVITGQPAIICTGGGEKTSHVYISLRNVGNSPVILEQVVIAGYPGHLVSGKKTIDAGESTYVEAEMPAELCSYIQNNRTVDGVLITNSGVYSVTFLVVR
ncbi:MAG: hypothetical protein QXW36_03080 [Desulfurococcaceae archaeon]